MITLKLAGISVGIDNRFSHIEFMARDYLTDSAPLFTVSVTDEDIGEERELSGTDYSNGYYESIVAYRKIAERLPEFDAFVFHGSVLSVGDEKAYIITANSGVGKTTHTRLWLSEFPDVDVLNGDKPILRVKDGVTYACGTPWQGKEGYGKPMDLPVSGIAFLSRAEENRAAEIPVSDAVTRFMSQIYIPKKSRSALIQTMRLANKVIGSAKLVQLECNMQPEAAHIARKALEG